MRPLIFFNALTDVPITSRKTRVEVANFGKTMTFYESIQAFPKISVKTSDFNHSNYRLFERIPVSPGTSNNRGLTVYELMTNIFLEKFFKFSNHEIHMLNSHCYRCSERVALK